MPAISVIVPAYNAEKTLNKCLDSIINQTLVDIEIIVVNDGSTDSTEAIVESYMSSDNRIKLISQINQGLGAARNVGLDNAIGEYISFIDSDDWISKNFLYSLYTYATTNNAEIAVGEIVRAVPTGSHFTYSDLLVHKGLVCSKVSEEKYALAQCPKHNYVWNKIYKHNMLKKSGVRFEEGVIFEDIEWTNKVIYYLRRLVTVPGAKYYYRYNTISLMIGKSDKWMKDFNHVMQKTILFRQSINPEIADITEFDWTTKTDYKFLGINLMQVRTYGLYKQFYLFGKFLVFEIQRKCRQYEL